MVQQAIRSYYLIVVLTTLGQTLHAATYVTFLIRQGGLSLFEINLVNVAFFSTVALMEVPTGVFADVFGRRASFLVSCVVTGAGLFIYGVSTSFWGFVSAEMIIALGVTFASGAFDAWIVDQLQHHGFEGTFEGVFSRGAVFGKMIGMAGAVVGASVFDLSMALPWFLGGAVYFIAGLVAWRIMREDYFTRKSASWRSHFQVMRETMMTGVAISRKSSIVRFVTILVVLRAFAVQAPNMQWQPFFGRFLTTQLGQGFIWVGIGIVTIFGAAFAPRFRRFFGDERNGLVMLQVVACVGIALVPVFVGSFGLAIGIYLAHEAVRGIFGPLCDSYLARGITSSAERATILSFQSLWGYAAGALGLVASGWAAAHWSLGAAWGLSGLTLVVAGAALWRRRA
mgnify:CR=1 FL=1